MKILLMVSNESLPYALTTALNPKNDYCAIVTDKVQPAKDFAKKSGLPENIIFPLYELKHCIDEIYFDVLICVSDEVANYSDLLKYTQRCGCPQNKFVHLRLLNQSRIFVLERALRYYEQHSDEFEIFATGACIAAKSLDTTKFKYKLLNFGRSSQDLYYSYQIAKRILTPKKGEGGRNFRYAIITLGHFGFHWDFSMVYTVSHNILDYTVALNDLHNFYLPPEQYKSLFNENFLAYKLPFEDFDINNVMLEKNPMHVMDFTAHLKEREIIEIWNTVYFPKTREENLKTFDDYLALCREKNVRPIICTSPVSECYKKYFSKKMISEFNHDINEFLKKYPEAVFLEGADMQGFDDSDFYEINHLNTKGAAKFSTILNGVIEKLEKH